MDILSINFRKIKSNILIEYIENGKFTILSKKSEKQLFSQFENAVLNGDFLSATNISIACIHLQLPNFFEFIKARTLCQLLEDHS